MTIVHKTLIVIAALLMQAALGLAQQTAAAPQEPATVEGMVINSQTSRSVPRAQVICKGSEGRSPAEQHAPTEMDTSSSGTSIPEPTGLALTAGLFF